MARQYDNRRAPRARSNGLQKFLLMTGMFFLGYFTAIVFDFETVTHWFNTKILASHERTKAPSTADVARKTTIPPKPKFEFYTLLANDKAAVSAHSAATANAAATATAHAVTPPPVPTVAIKLNVAAPVEEKAAPAGRGTYSVQVASFKARQDADQMKGLLTLKGFNVNIATVTNGNSGTWFRVVVGPYANRSLAQKAQVNLARNERLRGMVTSG